MFWREVKAFFPVIERTFEDVNILVKRLSIIQKIKSFFHFLLIYWDNQILIDELCFYVKSIS